MPQWARLKTTRDETLSYRMLSVFENGYGDEGPMAKGCCLMIMLVPLIITGGMVFAVLALYLEHILF